jgi:hypothetical protein
MVNFAVELDQLDIELGAHATHGVLAVGEHRVGEHRGAGSWLPTPGGGCSSDTLCRARR